MALCVQCLGLDKALHVSVREIEIAAQGDLIGMHVVGAVIEAQTREGVDALVASKVLLREVHGHQAGGHAQAAHVHVHIHVHGHVRHVGHVHSETHGERLRGRHGDGLVEPDWRIQRGQAVG